MSLEAVVDLNGMKQYLASLKFGDAPDLDGILQRLTVLEESCKNQPVPKTLTKKELQTIARSEIQKLLKELVGE